MQAQPIAFTWNGFLARNLAQTLNQPFAFGLKFGGQALKK
jgi:hypothetical protein